MKRIILPTLFAVIFFAFAAPPAEAGWKKKSEKESDKKEEPCDK